MKMRIVFIGAGNLSFHLSRALQKAGYEIIQVYSRTKDSAKNLAEILNCNYTNSVNSVDKHADIYFFVLTDNIIEKILIRLNLYDKIFIHCSGTLNRQIFDKFTPNSGVFYPLQTFSKEKNINFKEIPVIIEGSNENAENLISDIALRISDSVIQLNYNQRVNMHIAAVFASNFTNHLLSVSSEIIRENNLDFNILKPLIKETIEKALLMKPFDAQTGPAIRNDKKVIKIHKELLKNNKGFLNLYNLISKSIQNQRNSNSEKIIYINNEKF